MSDTPTSNDNIDHLVPLFREFNTITGNLQNEMAAALTANEANRIDLCKWLKKSENDMQIRMNKAVYSFVGAMPLASMNGVNLFMEALLLHVQLTGDETLKKVVEQINELESE